MVGCGVVWFVFVAARVVCYWFVRLAGVLLVLCVVSIVCCRVVCLLAAYDVHFSVLVMWVVGDFVLLWLGFGF